MRQASPVPDTNDACRLAQPLAAFSTLRSLTSLARRSENRKGGSTTRGSPITKPTHADQLSTTPLQFVVLCIAGHDELGQIRSVKTTAKRRAKSEAELLDHATNNLARALKRDMLKKDGRIDYDKLRKKGYSERLLAKLEQA